MLASLADFVQLQINICTQSQEVEAPRTSESVLFIQLTTNISTTTKLPKYKLRFRWMNHNEFDVSYCLSIIYKMYT